MVRFSYKGRERLVRGPLSAFEDLPLEKQEVFKSIKEIIVDLTGKKIQAYVYGSYLHGLWDDESDYDVIIRNLGSIQGIDELIKEKLGVRVNIVFLDAELSSISIP